MFFYELIGDESKKTVMVGYLFNICETNVCYIILLCTFVHT